MYFLPKRLQLVKNRDDQVRERCFGHQIDLCCNSIPADHGGVVECEMISRREIRRAGGRFNPIIAPIFGKTTIGYEIFT